LINIKYHHLEDVKLKFNDRHITIENNIDLNIAPYISDYAPNSCLVNENITFMAFGKNLEMVNFPFITFGNQNILNPELKENSIIFGQVPPSHIPQTVQLYLIYSNQYLHFGYFTYYNPITQSISNNNNDKEEYMYETISDKQIWMI